MDVANAISEKVGKEVEKLRGDMHKSEIDHQIELNQMKHNAVEADRERAMALASVKKLKE